MSRRRQAPPVSGQQQSGAKASTQRRPSEPTPSQGASDKATARTDKAKANVPTAPAAPAPSIKPSTESSEQKHGESPSFEERTQWENTPYATPPSASDKAGVVDETQQQQSGRTSGMASEAKAGDVCAPAAAGGAVDPAALGTLVPGERGQTVASSVRKHCVQPAYALLCRVAMLLCALGVVLGCVIVLVMKIDVFGRYYGMAFCVANAALSGCVAEYLLWATVFKWSHTVLPAAYKKEKAPLFAERKVACDLKPSRVVAALFAEAIAAVLMLTAAAVLIYYTAATPQRYVCVFAVAAAVGAAFHGLFIHYWATLK